MMNEINYPGIDMNGTLCRGFYLYCQFDYQYLICKSEHIPDDPLLGFPLLDLISNTVYGEQFLIKLHEWKNLEQIFIKIYCYFFDDVICHKQYSQSQMIKIIAVLLSERKLLVYQI